MIALVEIGTGVIIESNLIGEEAIHRIRRHTDNRPGEFAIYDTRELGWKDRLREQQARDQTTIEKAE